MIAAGDPLARDDEGYRTCAHPVGEGVCGRDCDPDPVPTDAGMRIAFTCPVHGVHSVVDPFDGWQ
ncbi:hypothetical protein [Blastococcus sp. Marseille-P5729]|uniref:hypothetical protein n=1 Tax=Blastococcus sp. Marseille-P5729 TaxID=2086582 RepID=UPI000D0FB422|nr:hypothetical protein [Blastococcus sp. Marseille-P5729]